MEYLKKSFKVSMMNNELVRKCPVCLKTTTIFINGICQNCDKEIKAVTKKVDKDKPSWAW